MTTLIVIVLYLCLLLGLGFFSSRLFRGTSKDYFVASHSIGPFLLLMSVFGTTMTAFALVGSTGKSFERGIGTYGLMASISGLVHAGIFFLIGIRLWAFGKKYGYITQIQFFRARFESDRHSAAAASPRERFQTGPSNPRSRPPAVPTARLL